MMECLQKSSDDRIVQIEMFKLLMLRELLQFPCERVTVELKYEDFTSDARGPKN